MRGNRILTGKKESGSTSGSRARVPSGRDKQFGDGRSTAIAITTHLLYRNRRGFSVSNIARYAFGHRHHTSLPARQLSSSKRYPYNPFLRHIQPISVEIASQKHWPEALFGDRPSHPGPQREVHQPAAVHERGQLEAGEAGVPGGPQE